MVQADTPSPERNRRPWGSRPAPRGPGGHPVLTHRAGTSLLRAGLQAAAAIAVRARTSRHGGPRRMPASKAQAGKSAFERRCARLEGLAT